MSRYVTVAQLRDQAQVGDMLDDDVLETALNSTEEQVDEYCRRRFDLDEEPTARLYDTAPTSRLVIDDVIEVDTVENRASTSGLFVEVDGWELGPLNAEADGRPYTTLIAPTVTLQGRVRVTGTFGWPQVPDVIVQATLLQASRMAQRRNAAFGIAPVVGVDGTAGMRLQARLDADVELLLAPFRRRPVLI